MLFKLLCPRPDFDSSKLYNQNVNLTLPDTLVINDKSSIPNFLLTTILTEGGLRQLIRVEALDMEHILHVFLRDNRTAGFDIVAVLKYQRLDLKGCASKLVIRKDFPKILEECLLSKQPITI